MGINARTLRFLDVFLLHCLSQPSPDDSPQEIAAMARNQQCVAERGREPGLQLQRGDATVALRDYCTDLLSPVQGLVVAAADRIDWAVFDRAVLTDKKGTRDGIRVVLPVASGGLGLISFPREAASMDAIRDSMAAGLAEVTA